MQLCRTVPIVRRTVPVLGVLAMLAGCPRKATTSTPPPPENRIDGATDLCRPLEQLIAASGDGFTGIRGAPDVDDPDAFTSTITMPGYVCWVLSAHSQEIAVSCTRSIEEEATAAVALFEQAVATVEGCLLPGDWERSDDGEHERVYWHHQQVEGLTVQADLRMLDHGSYYLELAVVAPTIYE